MQHVRKHAVNVCPVICVSIIGVLILGCIVGYLMMCFGDLCDPDIGCDRLMDAHVYNVTAMACDITNSCYYPRYLMVWHKNKNYCYVDFHDEEYHDASELYASQSLQNDTKHRVLLNSKQKHKCSLDIYREKAFTVATMVLLIGCGSALLLIFGISCIVGVVFASLRNTTCSSKNIELDDFPSSSNNGHYTQLRDFTPEDLEI